MATASKTSKPKTESKKKVVPLSTPRNDLSAQLETLKSDVSRLTETVKAEASAKFADAKVAVKETASDSAETAKTQYDRYAARAEASIRKNPLTAVAIAVGAGLLIGASRRRR